LDGLSIQVFILSSPLPPIFIPFIRPNKSDTPTSAKKRKKNSDVQEGDTSGKHKTKKEKADAGHADEPSKKVLDVKKQNPFFEVSGEELFMKCLWVFFFFFFFLVLTPL
jgi:hypothetical protein